MVPELLSPAGNLEKMKTAAAFGAGAVYLGGGHSLRSRAGNFDGEQLKNALAYAHTRNVRVYMALNIFAFEKDMHDIRETIINASKMGIDAFIVSDPGVLSLVRELAPNTEIHISTQANTTNAQSAVFWHKQGAKRVILARELSLEDICSIRKNCPASLELEVFVHGAMCVAYSGRCLLSSYFTYRSGNRGDCAQPCRYQYFVMEEKRPGTFFPVAEDEGGVSLFSASDLCMVEHIPDLLEAGIHSFKIEGRMKSAFYVGVTTQAYRQAMDDYFTDPVLYEKNKPEYINQINKCASHGGFSTGFYYGKPGTGGQDYSGFGSMPCAGTRIFAGIVRGYNALDGLALIEQRNNFGVGDTIEFIRAKKDSFTQTVRELWDAEGNKIDRAPHPQQKVWMKTEKEAAPLDMIGIVNNPCRPSG